MRMSARSKPDGKAAVACIGLGPIGMEVARAASSDGRFAVTYAVDSGPGLAGSSLAALLQADSRDGGGPEILRSIEELPRASSPRVAFLCTGSRLATVAAQVQQLIDRKWNVVSTCEELAFPAPANRGLWERMDQAAQRAGVSVLGVGINPGFVMDLLPAVLALPCLNPRRVRVFRRVDASRRRRPLQSKAGVGLTQIEFRHLAETNQIGHIGLQESARLLAASLGWELDTISDDLEPIMDVPREQVMGLREVLRGSDRSGRGVELELEMYAGAMNEVDEITIEADPPVHCVITGGYHGDRATVGVVLNSAIAVLSAVPGLHTVLDLALVATREFQPRVVSPTAQGPG